MFDGLLTVKYLTSKNCFCCFSFNNFKHLQSGFVKLLYNDTRKAHVSVGPGAIDDQFVGINSLFAKALGIDENSLVAVSEIAKPPTIQSVTISTQDENDHYVLESLAASVQSTLLEQIRVLDDGQTFIIWIGKVLHVTVSVRDVKPISPGQIDNLTEVVIKPPEKELKNIMNETKTVKIFENNSKTATFDFLTDYMNVPEKLLLRIVPFKELSGSLGKLCNSFNAFVSRSVFSQNREYTFKDGKIYQMTLLLPDIEKSAYVTVFSLEDILPDMKLNKMCSENIFVSDTLMAHFNNCDIGTRVLLEPFDGQLPDVKEVEIYTKRDSSCDILRTFQQYLADNCREREFVLNADVLETYPNNLKCFVRFQPCGAKFCIVSPDFVRNCKLVVINEHLPQMEVLDKDEFCWNKYITKVSNYDDIIEKCLFLFTYNTKVFSKMYNVLITGKAGTGKTTLSEIIKQHINSFPYYIFTKKISCKSMKGKTVDSLHKIFTTAFFDLIHHQPSVLILDDIHIICESVNEGEGLLQQAVYFNRVSEMLEGLFQKFCEHNAVGILATAESTNKLNKFMYATRGNHLFKNVYDIQQLSRSDRRELVEYFFLNCKNNLDLDKCSERTESFVIQDMVDLANKTLFESYQEDPDQNVLKINQDHFDTALKTVTETSLAGVNLHPPGEKNLDDIGGLNTAKKILMETMLWPAKYPDLFTNAPLRLPSGLLLYGPPGTGKTLLAGAAAKHCGLRLISIKGPELLSKYIGASEQAVRDVFQRAQSAKPCILFFDEFDSLAPRRGHDNTGVTDRVVNQLLTQLDGIESLSGVFVLAATSRPDLLDPALLRPGRLDIHIRCSLPDETSRLEILKVLSKSLKFSSDVNLSKVAEASDGFSGADLQAVLYSAQLDSVKGLLEDEASMQEFQVEEIHQAQLMEALKNTRPSLTKTEQMKYEQIYRNFEGGGSKDFTPGSRATLA